MSKNFEEEYKEYLNAQAPDLWERIEAGVEMLGQETPQGEKVALISEGKAKTGKKKRAIRYQHYRALVSVAACLFALILIVPVYLLTRQAGKASDNAAQETPMMLTDATIQNIEVAEEAEEAVEDSAPMEIPTEEAVEVEVAPAETEEGASEMAQVNENTDETQLADVEEIGEETGKQVASGEETMTDGTDLLSEVTQEVVPAQEDMQVMVLGPGSAVQDGIMYTATVIGSASSEAISLFVASDNNIVLEAEKTYFLTLELSADSAYYTVVAVAPEK